MDGKCFDAFHCGLQLALMCKKLHRKVLMFSTLEICFFSQLVSTLKYDPRFLWYMFYLCNVFNFDKFWYATIILFS